MGLIEFMIFCFIVVALAFVGTWLISQIPNCPPIVPKIIWIVAIIIIVVMLLRVIGVAGHDPQIPHLQ